MSGAEIAVRGGHVQMPHYAGSCHCGAVRFEIDAVIDRITVGQAVAGPERSG